MWGLLQCSNTQPIGKREPALLHSCSIKGSHPLLLLVTILRCWRIEHKLSLHGRMLATNSSPRDCIPSMLIASGSMPSKRQRHYVPPLFVPADENIAPLLDAAKRHCAISPAAANSALTGLVELTSWQSHNQQGVVDTNGLCTLFELLRQGVERRAAPANATQRQQQDEELETVRLTLWVLMNLAANDAISPRIASEPDCLRHLVLLLDPATTAASSTSCQCAVLAARCLVNLSLSSAAAQHDAYKVRTTGFLAIASAHSRSWHPKHQSLLKPWFATVCSNAT